MGAEKVELSGTDHLYMVSKWHMFQRHGFMETTNKFNGQLDQVTAEELTMLASNEGIRTSMQRWVANKKKDVETIEALLGESTLPRVPLISETAAKNGLDVHDTSMKPIYGSVWRWITGRPLMWVLSYHFTFRDEK